MADHDLLEVQIKVSGENTVLGGADQQLAALALGHRADGAEVLGQLRLQPRLAVQGVELNNPAVPPTSRDDRPVLRIYKSVNIPYGQSSAKLSVIQSFGSFVSFWSFLSSFILSFCHSVIFIQQCYRTNIHHQDLQVCFADKYNFYLGSRCWS